MAKDNDRDQDKAPEGNTNRSGVRARNRTEMLTPEMTRQMRADFARGEPAMIEDTSRSDGFESPLRAISDSQGTPEQDDSGFSGFRPQAEVRVPSSTPKEIPAYTPPPLITQGNRYDEPAEANTYNGASGPPAEVEAEAFQAPESQPFAPYQSAADEPAEEEQPYQPYQYKEEPEYGRVEAGDDMAEDNRYSSRSAAPQFTTPSSGGAGFGASDNGRDHGVSSNDERVIWQKLSPLSGFLVTYDRDSNGEYHELRNGRMIVTSELGANGNVFYIPDETVSPMHAIMKIADGEIQVLDQLSEQGTKIKKLGSEEVEHLSGEKGVLEHGDTVWFGDRRYHVCLVRGAKEN